MVLFFYFPMASLIILWQSSIGLPKATCKTLSKLFVNILFFCLVFMQFWTKNALLELVMLMHYTLVMPARTNKFLYFIFKVLFQVIIDQTSLKFLSNQSVITCNLNAKNFLFITTKFINEGYFFLQFHS